LALGQEDDMLCLECLAKQTDSSPDQVLLRTREYVLSRECFRKEWQKYGSRSACPDPFGCLPDVCFGAELADYSLDLRGVACPINFVKTRLFLDKMQAGQSLEVWLDDGEPVESVTASVASEGHSIKHSTRQPEGFHKITIVRT
jgi:TusA-related sulfurtransferase